MTNCDFLSFTLGVDVFFTRRMNWFIFILFFLSGACGLIYEVVWSRMMTLIFGRSILAVGIVLAAFMLGLALGSYALGRCADRSQRAFAALCFL